MGTMGKERFHTEDYGRKLTRRREENEMELWEDINRWKRLVDRRTT
jgi:hypothetical protein